MAMVGKTWATALTASHVAGVAAAVEAQGGDVRKDLSKCLGCLQGLGQCCSPFLSLWTYCTKEEKNETSGVGAHEGADRGGNRPWTRFRAHSDKSDDDHTAIGLLHNFTKHLNDSFKLLTATRRSVESKKNFPGYYILVIKNPHRL